MASVGEIFRARDLVTAVHSQYVLPGRCEKVGELLGNGGKEKYVFGIPPFQLLPTIIVRTIGMSTGVPVSQEPPLSSTRLCSLIPWLDPAKFTYLLSLTAKKNGPLIVKKGRFLKPPFSSRKPPLKKGSISDRPFFHD
jgi:hypothetical protein